MFEKLSISIKVLFSTYKHKRPSPEKKKRKKSKPKRPVPEKREKQEKMKEVDMCTGTNSCRCYSPCSCSYSTCTYYLSPFREPKHVSNCRCKSWCNRNSNSDDDDNVYIFPLSYDELSYLSRRLSCDSYSYHSPSRYSYGSGSRGSRFEPYHVPLGSSSSLPRWWSRGPRHVSGGGRQMIESMKIVPRGSSGRYY